MTGQIKHRLHLRPRNTRWKWMAGATAATAAGVAASQANTITINLLDNYISTLGGNHLNADLTGDGLPDLLITNAFHSVRTVATNYKRFYAGAHLNGVSAYAFASTDYGLGLARLGAQTKSFYRPAYHATVTGSIPVFFKDLHIRNGALTKGLLEVNVFSSTSDTKIQLDSLTYQTPDQGSTLALLAMGAGGVLALRRWKAAHRGSQTS